MAKIDNADFKGQYIMNASRGPIHKDYIAKELIEYLSAAMYEPGRNNVSSYPSMISLRENVYNEIDHKMATRFPVMAGAA